MFQSPTYLQSLHSGSLHVVAMIISTAFDGRLKNQTGVKKNAWGETN
jgi:hypothetical protein